MKRGRRPRRTIRRTSLGKIYKWIKMAKRHTKWWSDRVRDQDNSRWSHTNMYQKHKGGAARWTRNAIKYHLRGHSECILNNRNWYFIKKRSRTPVIIRGDIILEFSNFSRILWSKWCVDEMVKILAHGSPRCCCEIDQMEMMTTT